jgi:cell division protein FtsW (lipid II flippase)
MGRLRRNTELGLILLAAVITLGAYVLASLGRTADIPANIVPFLGFVLALLGAAHIATRRLVPDADGLLLPLAGLLNGIGYVFIARLDDGLAGLQATWTAVGIAAYIGTLLVVRRTRDLQRYRYTFMVLGIGLLLLPLVPGVGRTIRGAQIWVAIGPVNFQPGEFAKVVLAIFFAAYLAEKHRILAVTTWRLGPIKNFPDPKHLGPVLIAWGASLVIMMAQRDLGSSLLFFALFMIVLWVGTERGVYLGVGTLLFTAGALFAWRTFSHVQDRIEVWRDPWTNFDGAGYQLGEAAFSLAAGGLAGTGLGLGDPTRIPVAATDFIFAAIGEELGLLGASAVIVAFMLLIGSGLRIAIRADNAFDKLLAAGLTAIVGLQSFIIIGGVIRLVPLTGITLPFVSYGGSSLVANYVLLALLMRISDGSDGAEPQVEAAR